MKLASHFFIYNLIFSTTMFSQDWFWMYVVGIAMVKANIFNAQRYENNAFVYYSSIVLYVALIVFVFLVCFLTPKWWWGLVMYMCGWAAQSVHVMIRNHIRVMTAIHGSPAGNVIVRSIEIIAAPVLTILAYLFFFNR